MGPGSTSLSRTPPPRGGTRRQWRGVVVLSPTPRHAQTSGACAAGRWTQIDPALGAGCRKGERGTSSAAGGASHAGVGPLAAAQLLRRERRPQGSGRRWLPEWTRTSTVIAIGRPLLGPGDAGVRRPAAEDAVACAAKQPPRDAVAVVYRDRYRTQAATKGARLSIPPRARCGSRTCSGRAPAARQCQGSATRPVSVPLPATARLRYPAESGYLIESAGMGTEQQCRSRCR
jgi:hypothetical protein